MLNFSVLSSILAVSANSIKDLFFLKTEPSEKLKMLPLQPSLKTQNKKIHFMDMFPPYPEISSVLRNYY